jgi:hypothetical protein
MDHEQPARPYHAYVLRMWSEDTEEGRLQWRYTLLEPQSGRRLGFETPADLADYLTIVTGGEGDVDS